MADPLVEVLSLLSPTISIQSMIKLGEGWDSITYLLNKSEVLRLPKRAQTEQQMLHEIQVLNVIHLQTELTVPQVKIIGPAVGGLPISFMIYPLIDGTPMSSNLLSEHSVLQEVGDFVSELHSIRYDLLTESHLEWFRWTGVSKEESPNWEAGFRCFTDKIVECVGPMLDDHVRQKAQNHLLGFLSHKEHFKFQPVLIHGDLSAEHILVDKGHVAGIIDFGDSGIGDPAYDICSKLLPFYKGEIDETFSIRQRFYRTLVPFHKILYGLEINDQKIVSDGLREISTLMSSLG